MEEALFGGTGRPIPGLLPDTGDFCGRWVAGAERMSASAPKCGRFSELILLLSLVVAAHGAPSKVKVGTCAPLYPPFVLKSWSSVSFTGLEVSSTTRAELFDCTSVIGIGLGRGAHSAEAGDLLISAVDLHDSHKRNVSHQ